MRSRYQIILLVVAIVLVSLSITAYKIKYLGFSLSPESKKSVYEIEAKISFENEGKKGALISLALPVPQRGFKVVSENTASSDFGFVVVRKDGVRRAEWAKRNSSGRESVYYTQEVIPDPSYKPDEGTDNGENRIFSSIELSRADEKLLQTIIDRATNHSVDDVTFASYLLSLFNEEKPPQSISLIERKYFGSLKSKRDALAVIMAKAGIKFRTIGAIRLDETKKFSRLIPMFEVYDKERKEWQLFDLKKGAIDKPADLYFWQRGADSLLITRGVKKVKISFSVTRTLLPARSVAEKLGESKGILSDFSLFSLPIESQNSFKRLLLVPIGALVVVLLRLFVGLKTSGTFMPVLIAMAFAETKLIPGILMFVLVVSIGLLIRSYLSSLNLLLVARISAVLIFVVGIMIYVAILSYKLGFQDSITITFFPMIILAWTIERMSILWEEDGPKEVLIQGGGSLFVAILAYFAMTNPTIGYITYNFPETLLIVLAIVILVGRYSGYRLSELYRFASFAKRLDR
jgi:hypothetical protein